MALLLAGTRLSSRGRQRAAWPAFIHLVERATGIGKVILQKGVINPFDIHVDTLKGTVQEQSGKITPRCRYLEISQDFCDQRFAKQAAELLSLIHI